ncbi:DUF1801 domain-containing protein [Marinomonas rhizomae]|uniref:YdhG-like domain-containing protein n=1 Tax=Marinomonas rhizomae TaxID=491948 RepID=A0A366J463_9GAMM|nr:DUF1801 domain-containing protein [Marinomonas rhizomae]RBP81712.1 hypothetical protein DFP80_10911 [Marinomonas rhizomae]RNF72842.1 DUF1801 domain-containing protein [Marinomonas rhizomae]
MLTLVSNDFVNRYVQQAPLAIREDLLEVIQMMTLIAPDAKLVSDLGIPYFQQNASWLYGVAAREDHLCIYFSDLHVLHSFENRLPHAQFGDDCLILYRLDEINRNVFMELLGQIKVHFFMNHREPFELI